MSSTTTGLQLPEGRTTLQILKAARDLISVPERWTQEHEARSDSGRPVLFDNPAATCWCPYGAIRKVSGKGYGKEIYAVDAALEKAFDQDVASFNDSHSHAEVLAAFDRAIDAAGGSNGE